MVGEEEVLVRLEAMDEVVLMDLVVEGGVVMVGEAFLWDPWLQLLVLA